MWSVELSAEGVYRDTVLKLALRLPLARDEREKPRRCVEAETVAWSSTQFGEVSCSLDNDELAEACEASLLQSIEEEQLRLSQVPRSRAGYELSQLASRVTSAMHAGSANGDDLFAKVKSLISEMIVRSPRALPTRRMVTEMLDAVESVLPRHVEDMELQVSFSGLRGATAVLEQPEKVDSCGLMWTWSAGTDHPDVQLGRNVSAGWTVSGRDGHSNDSVAGRERTAMAKTFKTARTSPRM